MLIIISDIHLSDGTCAKPITPAAFKLFADRVQELARNASRRVDGSYRPLEGIDIILMGDILDVLHSTLWLEKDIGEPGFVRPWTDFQLPEFAAKIDQITDAILNNNAESIAILKELARSGLRLPAASNQLEEISVEVHLHYMVGNHDWYYHLPGVAFDQIRTRVVEAFGLWQSNQPFPHELKEAPDLQTLLAGYQVYAQHGDLYDSFNYNKERGRNASTVGDAFVVEILNRFPVEVEKNLGNQLPPGLVDSLRELVNVRPALATPLWISSQLRQNNIDDKLLNKIKELWDGMSRDFLKLAFVQEGNRAFKLDPIDEIGLVIRLTDTISFKTLDALVVWIRKKINPENITYARHALAEATFLNRQARFVVYGHTHRHEIIPLDSFPNQPHPTNQMYINSGTWHPYYDLAIYKPEQQKFIPYQVATYIAFYKDDERQGRRFETWSGAFSE